VSVCRSVTVPNSQPPIRRTALRGLPVPHGAPERLGCYRPARPWSRIAFCASGWRRWTKEARTAW